MKDDAESPKDELSEHPNMIQVTMTATKKINLLLITLSIIIVLVEWLCNYTTINVFFHFVLISVILFIIWIILVKVKFLNKIILQLFLTILVIIFTVNDLSYLYSIHQIVVAVPPNYMGNFSIRVDDRNSKISVKPLNKIIVFPVNNNGRFATNSNFSLPLNRIIVCIVGNKTLDFNNDLMITDVELLKHDSTDGNYSILKGEIISQKNLYRYMERLSH